MTKPHFQTGDRVRVDRIPASVIEDSALVAETKTIFQMAQGKSFTVRGVNELGWLELWLQADGSEDASGSGDSIWIEQECVSASGRSE